jgi:hypothetical protein
MSAEPGRPDFLPQGAISSTELKIAVLANVEKTLDLIKPLPTHDLSLPSLEAVPIGSYYLPTQPSIDFIRSLPHFKKGTAEVGLDKIKDRWMISLMDGLETKLPFPVSALRHEQLFQRSLHSHPGDDPGATQLSRGDIEDLDSTIDGHQQIISDAGVVDYHKPTVVLPGGYSQLIDTEKAWRIWITDELGLNEQQFNERGGWNLKREFHEKYFGLRVIPWENTQEIERILFS